MEKDLTHGNTLKLIISFCIPLIGGAIFQQLYNVVDTMIVGRFVGVDALAAVGSTGSLNFLIIGFVLGLAAGFGIPIAQAFGAREEKRMLQTIMNAFYLCIFFSIVLTVLTHFTTETLLQWMQTPANIFKQSYDYISIILYSLPFFSLSLNKYKVMKIQHHGYACRSLFMITPKSLCRKF